MVDNRFVVPYNPYLLKKYDCHINVEVCCSVKSVKYLYKYVYKGHDAAVAEISTDEITEYLNARYVSAHEAIWRIFELPLFGSSHTINRLQVHLPDQQQIVFRENANAEDVTENRNLTKLEAFFVLCQTDDFAKTLKYQEIPEHFVWKNKKGEQPSGWTRRQRQNKGVLARMYTISPSEGERFYLRILLTAMRGPTSFNDLRTYEGVLYPTFQDAAVARGLLENDDEYKNCLTEAETFQLAPQMRELFVTILVFCNPSNVRTLFDYHFDALSEDFRDIQDVDRKEAQVLACFRDKLSTLGKTLADFPGLPPLLENLLDNGMARNLNDNQLLSDELGHSQESIDAGLECVALLNDEQRAVFDAVLASVGNDGDNLPCHFFVDGPAGTGKTFLYNAIIGQLRSEGKVVLVVASSGIAAYLLPGGRTAHSRFKIPLNVDADSVCNITKQSNLAQLIMQASLIIWDEAVMMNR